MSQPLVYIVILNFNGDRWLENCLGSLGSTSYDNYRILLVDNASTDGSVELVGRRFPQIRLIANRTNLGFSEGNNAGIREALADGAEYIVLLNPDTEVEPDWLSNLIAVGESDLRIGILGAVQLKYRQSGFNSWTESALSGHLDELKDPETARSWIPVEWVEGACLAAKREVYEKVGLLDPIYFAFYEEIDFCRRAACAGYKIALAPRSRIHHYRGGSWRANPEIERERDYRCNRSQFIYNLTDPRKTLLGNLRLYLVTLGTKGKELLANFSPARAWDLLRTQLDLLSSAGRLWDKWRRERALRDKTII